MMGAAAQNVTSSMARSLGGARNGECQLNKGPVISIVEDDADVRAATESLVKSQGFDVCAFASAQDFLRSHSAEQTACLISYVQMPVMSGMELQAALIDRGLRIPTIFVTAFTDESIKRRAMEAGAVGFLYKPFKANALIEFVHYALRRGGVRAEKLSPQTGQKV
jgi:FixJ family two-component response regulator